MEKQLMNSAISELKKVPKTKYFGPVKKINIDNPVEVQQHIESLKRFVRSWSQTLMNLLSKSQGRLILIQS